jgi:hypothetical protein
MPANFSELFGLALMGRVIRVELLAAIVNDINYFTLN